MPDKYLVTGDGSCEAYYDDVRYDQKTGQIWVAPDTKRDLHIERDKNGKIIYVGERHKRSRYYP